MKQIFETRITYLRTPTDCKLASCLFNNRGGVEIHPTQCYAQWERFERGLQIQRPN